MLADEVDFANISEIYPWAEEGQYPCIALTHKCNQNCLYCAYTLQNTSVSALQNDRNGLFKLIDNLPQNTYLGLSGGEPTISPYFFDVLEHIRDVRPDLHVYLATNGRMFYYDWFVRRFVESAPRDLRVGISLSGHNAELHDSITQTPGSFRQTIAGLANLLNEGIDVDVRVVVHAKNYAYLTDLVKTALSAHNGVGFFVFRIVHFSGNAHANADMLIRPISDLVNGIASTARYLLQNTNTLPVLLHVPYCLLPEDLHRFVVMSHAYYWTNFFRYAKVCENCQYKDRCNGFDITWFGRLMPVIPYQGYF